MSANALDHMAIGEGPFHVEDIIEIGFPMDITKYAYICKLTLKWGISKRLALYIFIGDIT